MPTQEYIYYQAPGVHIMADIARTKTILSKMLKYFSMLQTSLA